MCSLNNCIWIWTWLFLVLTFTQEVLTGHTSIPAHPTTLLYSTPKDIRIVTSTFTNRVQKLKATTIVRNYTYISGIDFHYDAKKICWSDHDRESIQCGFLNGTTLENKTEIVYGVYVVDGLAIDWFTSNIYWTASETNRIEVATLDGNHRKVLFWTDIDQPRAISVVPMEGLLFWTDWGEIPRIERAAMNGDPSTRKVIVSDNIQWPNGLTVDYEARRVYWIDGKLLHLKSMDYNGQKITTILPVASNYPYALTQSSTVLFWTDWKTVAIHSYLKNSTVHRANEFITTPLPMDIKVFDKQRQPLASHGCENNGGCSHLCLLAPQPVNYTCVCPIGIKLIDNKTCANEPQELLILARRADICLIYLDSPEYSYKVIPLNDVKYSIAVDFDPADNYIYWSDDEVKKIQRARLNGSDQQDVISTKIQDPDGIALDWISRNIYWTDTGTDQIEVARLNGGFRKVIIGDGLLDPRAIAVAPELGWLFWTDWNEKFPKVERSNLDGSERTYIAHDNLGWPNGIALDSRNKKIYWCDAHLDRIEYANMDGTDRRTLIHDNMPHPFGFTLMGEHLYWTDWLRRSLDRAQKDTGSNRQVIAEQMENVMGLKAIRLGDASGWNPCKDNNGNCSQLCLYRHDQAPVCACQIDFELGRDKRSCVKPEAFLVYSKNDSIGRISIENEPLENNLHISNIKHAVSIDVDMNNRRIYWSDRKTRTIMRANIDGSEPQKVIDLGLTFPEGIAVDWLGLNIYWTDPTSHRIEVSRLTGTSRRTLLWDEVYEPHSIVLDPVSGFMYWSEWGQSNLIKKAAMNGSKHRKLFTTNGRATSLTLDYEKRRLYWIEIDPAAIWSADLDGNGMKAIVKDTIFNPVGLALYKHYIYWGNTRTGQTEIFRAFKQNGTDARIIANISENITDLLMFHPMKHNLTNHCATSNGGCSSLCLALPADSPLEYTKFTCACPTHYTLHNNECKPPVSFMIYSLKNLVVRLLPDTSDCPEAVLPIPGLRAIRAIDFDPKSNVLYWVDGKTLTIKSSNLIAPSVKHIVFSAEDIRPFDLAVDAIGRLLFWTCASQNVINVTRLDNNNPFGTLEVRVGEKPRLLVIHVTKRLLFYTDVGDTPQLVRVRLDGSHRIVITKADDISAIAVDTENDSIVWSQGASIYISNIDGENKHVLVDDNSYKIARLTVHAGWLYWIDRDLNQLQRLATTGQSRSTLPVQASHIVDLISVKHLENHSCADQKRCSHFCVLNGTVPQCACPEGKMLQEDKRTCQPIPNCGPERFSCTVASSKTKDCIPLSWRCDRQKDCSDGSDELNCPSCSSNQFKCQNGECIEKSLVCDSKADCADKSDEKNCCENGFQCHMTEVCLIMSLRCDGTEQCADGSDEVDCPSEPHKNVIVYVLLIVFIGVIFFVSVYTVKRKHCCVTKGVEADPPEDSLSPLDPNGHNKNLSRRAIPDVVRMSMLPNDSSTSTYERRHITGASSSSHTNGSSSIGYPRETINPPPSPATTADSTRASSSASRYRPYRHYRTINQPPPPTPNSTDVCDESDYNYPLNQMQYDGPVPPPPTPRSHYQQESCPPSPISRCSTYFSPVPPPSPSPTASPRGGDSDS